MAQIAGLTAMSFGMEDVDRYIVVYKKEHAPSEDEIFARRNGEDWNPETAEKYAKKVWHICKAYSFLRHFYFLDFQRLESKEMEELRSVKSTEIIPNSNYKDKYAHLIGQEAAVEAAKRTESNKSYGFGKFHSILTNKVDQISM